MRLNAQNNQFIFQFPVDFIDKELYSKFERIINNKHMGYDNVLDYINSTIKEIIFPGLSFDSSELTYKFGKKIEFKESGNIFDKFQNELDVTFKSVDSHMNYFMMVEILTMFYMNNRTPYIPDFALNILDKTGDIIYTVQFKSIILKSISELRMSYQAQDVSEKQFSITFRYNWIDIRWELKENKEDESESIFDIPFEKGNTTIDQITPGTNRNLTYRKGNTYTET